MSDYADIALTAARGQGLAPADVRALGFAQIAALAGIDVAAARAAGDPCHGFSWEHVHAGVARALQTEIDQAAQDALEQAVAEAIAAAPNLTPEAIAAVSQGFDPVRLMTRIDQARVDLTQRAHAVPGPDPARAGGRQGHPRGGAAGQRPWLYS